MYKPIPCILSFNNVILFIASCNNYVDWERFLSGLETVSVFVLIKVFNFPDFVSF